MDGQDSGDWNFSDDDKARAPEAIAPAAPPPRPFFIPASVNFEALPPEVKHALNEIVAPVYDEYVVRATSALQRSVGTSLTFLLTLEVVSQFDIGHSLDLRGQAGEEDYEAREKRIARLLRIVGAKQKTEDFLLRLDKLSLQNTQTWRGDPLRPR